LIISFDTAGTHSNDENRNSNENQFYHQCFDSARFSLKYSN
jgi:hypothetical protein